MASPNPDLWRSCRGNRGELSTRACDEIIGQLGRHQFGVVARWQLILRGISNDQIDRRVANGRLLVLHRGVFLTAGAPHTDETTLRAAQLSCGSRAVLSHTTAAWAWGMTRRLTRPFHLTIPATRRVALPGAAIHRSRLLTPDQITWRRRFPVTRPLRTVIDACASSRQTPRAP
jgi:hypothetical protein